MRFHPVCRLAAALSAAEAGAQCKKGQKSRQATQQTPQLTTQPLTELTGTTGTDQAALLTGLQQTSAALTAAQQSGSSQTPALQQLQADLQQTATVQSAGGAQQSSALTPSQVRQLRKLQAAMGKQRTYAIGRR